MPGSRIRTPLLCAGLLLQAYAAWGAPLHWQVASAPAKAVRPGARLTLVITGQVDPGWHLYALEEPQGGPSATEVALREGDPADLLHVSESRPTVKMDPQFGMATGYFETAVRFMLTVQLDKSAVAGAQPLHVLVRYQSCNDHVCLPPHTDTVDVPLTVAK